MSEAETQKTTKTTRRKSTAKAEPKAEPAAREGGASVKKLENGRTRVTYPSGITIDK